MVQTRFLERFLCCWSFPGRSAEGWAAEVRRMQAMASSRINGREADEIIKFLAYDESHRKAAERDKATVDTNSDPVTMGKQLFEKYGVRRATRLAAKGTRHSARP